MANQRRHAHYARTGRQLTPRTSHPGTPTAQTPHVDAPRYTIPDYLRGHRAGTQHALSQDFRILTMQQCDILILPRSLARDRIWHRNLARQGTHQEPRPALITPRLVTLGGCY